MRDDKEGSGGQIPFRASDSINFDLCTYISSNIYIFSRLKKADKPRRVS